MSTKLDARQTVSRDFLDQLTINSDYIADIIGGKDANSTELDDLLRAINSDLTVPIRMVGSDPAGLVVTLDAAIITNPGTGRNTQAAPIDGVVPTFAGGTITFDATNAGNITPSVGSAIAITTATSMFNKLGVFLDTSGNLVLVEGTEGASAATAIVPNAVPGAAYIGYIVFEVDGAGNIQVINNSDIYQFVNANSDIGALVSQDRNIKMIGGGTWNFTAPDSLSWSANAYIQVPGMADDRNRIDPTFGAQSPITIGVNQIAYVDINRTDPGIASDLTVNVVDVDAFNQDNERIVIARRDGGDVLVGTSSFRLRDGEYLELDGALQEIRRVNDQLKIVDSVVGNADEVDILGADIAQLDGTTLSQELSNLILSFSGATINFTTGVISGGPLGTNFTPAVIPVGEYHWYSISLNGGTLDVTERISATVEVGIGSSSDAVQSSATYAEFVGVKKLGQVQVQNNGGTIEVVDIKRLGAGSGSGGGSTAGTLIEGGDWSYYVDYDPSTITGAEAISPGTTNGSVRASTIIGTDLYVGGFFTTVDGNNINRIAKYDTLTDTWSDIGGTSGNVHALSSIGTDLYIGGQFSTVDGGGVAANNIAKYDTLTDTWSDIGGTGGTNFVFAIHSIGTDLYVGGFFVTVDGGGVVANSIAKYDTITDTWSDIGGTNNTVYAIHSIGTDLYVGGQFSTVDIVLANNIAKYDTVGDVWSDIGGTDSAVRALHAIGTDLYVGGFFTAVNDGGPISANNIAKYDTVGDVWSDIGGTSGNVHALSFIGTDLYVGGTFTAVDTGDAVAANNIAKYDTVGDVWSDIGGTDDIVYSLTIDSDGVYVGGFFNIVDGVTSEKIGKFNFREFNVLDWSEDAYVAYPGLTHERNTLSAGSVEVASGQVVYTILNSQAGAPSTITPLVDDIENISPFTNNLFIIANNASTEIVVGESIKLEIGDVKELYSGGGGGFATVEISADYTAKGDDELMCNTSGGSFTVTLPHSADIDDGTRVRVKDLADTFGGNNLNIATIDGSTIEGTLSPLSIDEDGAWAEFVWMSTVNDWRMFTPIVGGGLQTLVIDNLDSPWSALDEQELFADTSAGTITIDLEASPSLGYRVRIIDHDGSWGTNNVTVNGNGNNINGAATLTLNVNDAWVELVYNGTEWRVLG